MPTAAEDEEMMVMRPAAATELHHDTMGIIALDVNGNVASGTTTNGATFKIPGFVTAGSIKFSLSVNWKSIFTIQW